MNYACTSGPSLKYLLDFGLSPEFDKEGAKLSTSKYINQGLMNANTVPNVNSLN